MEDLVGTHAAKMRRCPTKKHSLSNVVSLSLTLVVERLGSWRIRESTVPVHDGILKS
jgi:hypothetical protein